MKSVLMLIMWLSIGYSSIFIAAKAVPWPIKKSTVVMFTISGPISYAVIGVAWLSQNTTIYDNCILNCEE